MHKKNSDFYVNLDSIAHINPAKSADLTILKGGKFDSLSYRTEIALYYATNLYTNRCTA